MMDRVPVGAMVVTVPFLISSSSLYMLVEKRGKAPRSFASFLLAVWPTVLIYFMIFSAILTASSEL